MGFGVLIAVAAFWLRVTIFALAFVLPVQSAKAGDADNPITDFFSYFPAPPKISLPKIEIVPFWTDDLKVARKAYANGDYERARTYFQKSSDDGNPVADWYLGHMYRLGRGVPADQAVAYSYFMRVADTFNPDETDQNRLRITIDSQLRVADYQRLGIPTAGLKANPDAAARTYLRIASNYGHPHAMFALGAMSIDGDGTKKNPQVGLKWLNAACRKHSPEAAAYLGDLYAKGGLVQKDETRALTWYIIAAQLAQKEENPLIFARLNELRLAATDEVRIEAEARARVWSEQNPSQ